MNNQKLKRAVCMILDHTQPNPYLLPSHWRLMSDAYFFKCSLCGTWQLGPKLSDQESEAVREAARDKD